jgi:F-type H+-transporting ATPase subunit gamma
LTGDFRQRESADEKIVVHQEQDVVKTIHQAQQSLFEVLFACELDIGMLLPQLIKGRLYQALLEAATSEQGARRNAMESATDNAADMIHELTLLYNRTRQAAITTEILEVVVGGESLK